MARCVLLYVAVAVAVAIAVIVLSLRLSNCRSSSTGRAVSSSSSIVYHRGIMVCFNQCQRTSRRSSYGTNRSIDDTWFSLLLLLYR